MILCTSVRSVLRILRILSRNRPNTHCCLFSSLHQDRKKAKPIARIWPAHEDPGNNTTDPPNPTQPHPTHPTPPPAAFLGFRTPFSWRSVGARSLSPNPKHFDATLAAPWWTLLKAQVPADPQRQPSPSICPTLRPIDPSDPRLDPKNGRPPSLLESHRGFPKHGASRFSFLFCSPFGASAVNVASMATLYHCTSATIHILSQSMTPQSRHLSKTCGLHIVIQKSLPYHPHKKKASKQIHWTRVRRSLCESCGGVDELLLKSGCIRPMLLREAYIQNVGLTNARSTILLPANHAKSRQITAVHESTPNLAYQM